MGFGFNRNLCWLEVGLRNWFRAAEKAQTGASNMVAAKYGADESVKP